MMAVTIKDVARAAGVSTATVSRVLNNRGHARGEARARVLAAARQLGYRPNAVARSLRVEVTQTLGLIIGDVVNPFFAELARAVEDEARAHGMRVILGNADERRDRQDEYLGILLERRVDGLLLTPTADSSPLVARLVADGMPLVFVDREIPGLNVPVVRVDSRGATIELVDHLVRLGHRRIAIISGPVAISTGRERLDAFRAAMAGHGLALPATYVRPGDFQLASGVAAMHRLLDLDRPPSAVFAADNLMALGAFRVIRERGLRIPDDVGLASFDDLPWFPLADPPVTAVAQPTADLGRLAVRALLDLLAGRPVSSSVLPARLVARRSCGEGRVMS